MNALCTTSFDFLKNKNVLLISEDKDLIKSANYNLFEDLNRLEQVNSFLNITNYSKFDLIIIDIYLLSLLYYQYMQKIYLLSLLQQK